MFPDASSNTLFIHSRSHYRFRTGQGHCGTCRKKWGPTDNEMCVCGRHPLTKLDSGLQRLRTAGEAAVDWLTSYGT